MDNLEIYNKLRAVPEEAQRTIQAGKLKGFTDINPMWRIKTLTELFGVCGEGWVTKDVNFIVEQAGGETAVFCTLNLFVKINGKWSQPIFGIGGSKLAGKGVGDGINDEAHKMAYTDALSIACKSLGMAADIYYANDRTKYNSAQVSPAVTARRVASKRLPEAPAPTQTDEQYMPLPEAKYIATVAAHACGKMTKSGQSIRDWWIATTHAKAGHIMEFDHAVEAFRAQNNL